MISSDFRAPETHRPAYTFITTFTIKSKNNNTDDLIQSQRPTNMWFGYLRSMSTSSNVHCPRLVRGLRKCTVFKMTSASCGKSLTRFRFESSTTRILRYRSGSRCLHGGGSKRKAHLGTAKRTRRLRATPPNDRRRIKFTPQWATLTQRRGENSHSNKRSSNRRIGLNVNKNCDSSKMRQW